VTDTLPRPHLIDRVLAGDQVELKVGPYFYPVPKATALAFLSADDLLTAAKELGVVCDIILAPYSDAEAKRLEAAWDKLDAAIAQAEEGRASR
jgi:hypothetical protein